MIKQRIEYIEKQSIEHTHGEEKPVTASPLRIRGGGLEIPSKFDKLTRRQVCFIHFFILSFDLFLWFIN